MDLNAVLQKRITHAKGNPWIVGFTMGQDVHENLERTIGAYFGCGHHQRAVDSAQIQLEAMDWFQRLPGRYQEEGAGLAAGSGVPVQRIAEWAYIKKWMSPSCCGLIYRVNGRVWVARNCDDFAPDLWGYATIREIQDRIPTITFGMEGSLFSSTGINRETLWLHYQTLPGLDMRTAGSDTLDNHVWFREALETCRSIKDVEYLLGAAPRREAMLLVAVDGKTEEYSVFECQPQSFSKQSGTRYSIDVTQHTHCYQSVGLEKKSVSQRKNRLEALVKNSQLLELPDDLVEILDDDQVEFREDDYGTVYSNVVCPSQKEIWYTFGGYPAASQGSWARLPWPFDE